MDVFRILAIIFLYVALSISQDCDPCSCCKQDTDCSNNVPLGIDNYCWGGCKGGFMSPQCQKPCVNHRCETCLTETICDTCFAGYYGDQCCVNERCQTCSTTSTCDACYDGYYGDQCLSSCISTCTTCSSSTLCTSCKDGYHRGSGTLCFSPCKTECLSCTNSTSCTACKVRSGVGYYGSDCSMMCSNRCKDYLCDIYGNCLQCYDPYVIGDNCDRCIDGKYGGQCKNICPVNCLSCESATNCTSCTNGFKGITCSTKMECPDNCINNTVCFSSGKCKSCKDGFYGGYCNMTCSRNCRYGYCYRDGSCPGGCEDGFIGSRCEQRICPTNCFCDSSYSCIGCYIDYFGPSCSLTCSSCKDNQCPVDLLNIEKCDECAGGTFGNLCNITCPVYCLNNELGVRECRQTDGRCAHECEAGYEQSTTGCINVTIENEGYNDRGNGTVTAAVLGGVVALLSVALTLAIGYIVVIKRRHNRKHPTEGTLATEPRVEEESRAYEHLQDRIEQPNYQNVKDNGNDNYTVLFAETNI